MPCAVTMNQRMSGYISSIGGDQGGHIRTVGRKKEHGNVHTAHVVGGNQHHPVRGNVFCAQEFSHSQLLEQPANDLPQFLGFIIAICPYFFVQSQQGKHRLRTAGLSLINGQTGFLLVFASLDPFNKNGNH
jgi:hypothetical protein